MPAARRSHVRCPARWPKSNRRAAQLVADGATAVPVTISLRDAQGLPVAARTQVSLQASLGQWQTPDLDARQPGTQVFVEGGEGRFLLLPPAQPGKAELTVSSGTVKSAAAIEFMPNLRPMIAAGIVEGTINLRSLNPSALQPAQSGDVFERQIQSARAAFAAARATPPRAPRCSSKARCSAPRC
jgi:hypothetical protein